MTRDSIVKILQASDGWVPVANVTKVLDGRIGSTTAYKWIQSGIVRAKKEGSTSFIFSADLVSILDRYIANGRAATLVSTKFPFLSKEDGYEIYKEIEQVDAQLNVPDPNWLSILLDRIQLYLYDEKRLEEDSIALEQELQAKVASLETAVNSLTALVTAGSSSPLILPSRQEIKLLLIEIREATRETLSPSQALTWLSILAGLRLSDIQRVHEIGDEDPRLHIKTCASLANKCVEILSSPQMARVTGSSQNLDKRRGDSLYKEFSAKCVAYFYANQLKSEGSLLPVGQHPAEKMFLGLLPYVV